MPQSLRPVANGDTADWTVQNAVNAYTATADESDVTYIFATNTVQHVLILRSGQDPCTVAGHRLLITITVSVAGNVNVALETGGGGEPVAIKEFTGLISNLDYTLSEAEANAIGDYTNLQVRLTAIGGGKSDVVNVHRVEFLTPNPPKPMSLTGVC